MGVCRGALGEIGRAPFGDEIGGEHGVFLSSRSAGWFAMMAMKIDRASLQFDLFGNARQISDGEGAAGDFVARIRDELIKSNRRPKSNLVDCFKPASAIPVRRRCLIPARRDVAGPRVRTSSAYQPDGLSAHLHRRPEWMPDAASRRVVGRGGAIVSPRRRFRIAPKWIHRSGGDE